MILKWNIYPGLFRQLYLGKMSPRLWFLSILRHNSMLLCLPDIFHIVVLLRLFSQAKWKSSQFGALRLTLVNNYRNSIMNRLYWIPSLRYGHLMSHVCHKPFPMCCQIFAKMHILFFFQLRICASQKNLS